MTRQRIAPRPGDEPPIGRLVAMLASAREATVGDVAGLPAAEPDPRHDAGSNSIGALLSRASSGRPRPKR